MARVSLKEAYDNKDVVAQIYAIRDIAEGASDTADSAKTTADDAKTYVDNLGVQVEGAVQTANNASASAQASAQTVAGYDARLTEVEGDLNQAESDIDGLETGLGAVTARIQTAEGNIVTIQGRVTALETADGQNVKINNINAYAVGLTGNQTVLGEKLFDSPSVTIPGGWRSTYASTGNINEIKLFAKLKNPNVGRFVDLEITQSSNTANCYGILSVHITNGYPTLWVLRKTLGSNNNMTADSLLIAVDNNTGDVYLASRKKAVYGNLMFRIIKEVFYGAIVTVANSSVEWLPNAVNIGDGTGYTLIEAVE